MSANVTNCRGCGARIIWVVLPSGSKMPVDADPGMFGTIQLAANKLSGKVLSKEEIAALTPGEKLYTSHFQTCGRADDFRKRRR